MPRSCLCSRLLTRAATDAAFRLLPDSARLVWYEIMAMASAAPIPGRLRFLHSVPASVARLVSRSEPDVASDLADLEALGMIERDPDGVTLWMPGVRTNQARAEAARRNGLKGGAARKGETLEQRRDRRQAEMTYVINGSLPATQGTEAREPNGTEGGEAHARATTSTLQDKRETESLSPPGQVVSRAREEKPAGTPEWVTLGAEVAELAGLDGARGGFDYRPVQAWLNAGHPAEAIRAAVERIAARPGYDARRVRTLGYFGDAVAEEAARLKAEAATAPRLRTAEEIAREAEEEAEIARFAQAVREGRDVPMPARIAAARDRLLAERRAAA